MTSYWYIRFSTSAGPGACFVQTELHPLHPAFLSTWARETARAKSMATKAIVQPDSVIIDFLCEVPLEVAQIRYPDQFNTTEPSVPLLPEK
jgi:hypothetical protein